MSLVPPARYLPNPPIEPKGQSGDGRLPVRRRDREDSRAIRKGRAGHLWQARFHSCPMSESHFWIGLRYVEGNPCRANRVTSPSDCPWSSAAAHLSGAPDRAQILDLDFWERAGGAATGESSKASWTPSGESTASWVEKTRS
jgi:hypothetical protein